MNEQEATLTLVDSTAAYTVQSPPPDKLIFRDETGQLWAVTVRPDGQLQTRLFDDAQDVGI